MSCVRVACFCAYAIPIRLVVEQLLVEMMLIPQIFIHFTNIHSALSTISVCATIIKADNHPLTNCTRVQLKSDPAEAAVEVTHNKNEASLASLDSIHAKQVIQNVIEVTFEVKNQSSNVECKINLLVEAGDPDDLGERVLATHISRCEVEQFTFHNLRLQYED